VTVACTAPSRTIHISVREARMWVDRILLVGGLPSGYVPATRECVLVSQALGLGGLRRLLEVHDRLDMRRFEAIAVDQPRDSELVVDGAGLHAWLLAPTLTDLAVDAARKCGRADVRVRHVEDVDELHVISALARRHGTNATVVGLRDDADADCAAVRMTNLARPRSIEHADPVLHEAFRSGFPVDEALWRATYDLQKRALARDSVVSRRHAGPVIMLDDGTIVGRRPNDDDFDSSMLRSVSASPLEN
jgi:hypothetical protein